MSLPHCKPDLSFDQARAEIVKMSGTQFEPGAVQAFLAEQTALREMVAGKCMQPGDTLPRQVNSDERNWLCSQHYMGLLGRQQPSNDGDYKCSLYASAQRGS